MARRQTKEGTRRGKKGEKLKIDVPWEEAAERLLKPPSEPLPARPVKPRKPKPQNP